MKVQNTESAYSFQV